MSNRYLAQVYRNPFYSLKIRVFNFSPVTIRWEFAQENICPTMRSVLIYPRAGVEVNSILEPPCNINITNFIDAHSIA